MGLTTADTYYLKAKAAVDAYDPDWQEATEGLHYALSYDENHSAALCLLGKILAEQFSNYEEAFACFDKAIACNGQFLEVYYIYAQCVIRLGDTPKALRLIAFALSQKGANKSVLYRLCAEALEIKAKYVMALKMLEAAQLYNNDEEYTYELKAHHKRLKQKKKRHFKKLRKDSGV